jgi:hypothetical protein
MAPKRADTGILIGATAAILAIGLVIAGLFMVLTRGPKVSLPQRELPLGPVSTMRDLVTPGDPNFFSDPTGGGDGFYLDLVDGKFVAYVVTVPGTKDCGIRWAGSKDSYVDCHKNKISRDQLARYTTVLPTSGSYKDWVLVDLRKRQQPGDAQATSPSTSPPSTTPPS